MAAEAVVAPIREAVTVNGSPERAFRLFTDGLGSWWPPEYSWSAAKLEQMQIEPRPGGRCFERGPHGFHCDWGRVKVCEPPARLVFAWQINADRTPQPDPEQASEVEVRFTSVAEGRTRVELEHRGFERHRAGAAAYRDGMASRRGWPLLLARFEKAVGTGR
jgi:uncharacterized protein YndB with AHSA1/START domain